MLYPDATKLPGTLEPDVQELLLEKAKSRDFFSVLAVPSHLAKSPLLSCYLPV